MTFAITSGPAAPSPVRLIGWRALPFTCLFLLSFLIGSLVSLVLLPDGSIHMKEQRHKHDQCPESQQNDPDDRAGHRTWQAVSPP